MAEDALFRSTYDTVRGWVRGGEPVNVATVLSFTTRVMALLQTMVELRGDGARKKRLCLAVIRKVVTTEVQLPHEGDREALAALLAEGGMVDHGIDAVVGAVRGGLRKLPKAAGCCAVS